MIYSLRRKFIAMSAVAVAAVIAVVLLGTWGINTYQTNKVLDSCVELICLNEGAFPEFESNQEPPDAQDVQNAQSTQGAQNAPGDPNKPNNQSNPSNSDFQDNQDTNINPDSGANTDIDTDASQNRGVSDGDSTFPNEDNADSFSQDAQPPAFNENMQRLNDDMRDRGFLTQETQFSMRYFVVTAAEDGTMRAQMESIASVTSDQAMSYAQDILNKSKSAGWVNEYRFGVFGDTAGTTVVFVDGSTQIASMRQNMISTTAVLVGSGVVIMLLIVLFSKRIVRPVAESYEKQKRFITDANHELKTPLTLILSDLDILEIENGPSEWIDDMRIEGTNMAELVNQLVELSRMDEAGTAIKRTRLDMSALVREETERFEAAAQERGFEFVVEIDAGVFAQADEAAMRRLLSILLENALKYCDANGSVNVRLKSQRSGMHLTITNSFVEVGNTELDMLFERFYRSDKARTAGSGTGVGLSIAAAIVEGHKGSIRAYAADSTHIAFEVII